jgi:hypothetical protein
MSDTPTSTTPWWRDLLSERMIFGFLIIVGFIAIVHEFIYRHDALKPEIVTIIASAIGTLGAAIGIIVQAIWRTDRTDKQQAQTTATLANTLASAVASQSPSPPTIPPNPQPGP